MSSRGRGRPAKRSMSPQNILVVALIGQLAATAGTSRARAPCTSPRPGARSAPGSASTVSPMRSEHHPPEVLLREGDLLIMGGRDGNSVGHFSPRISATFVQLRSHACSDAPALRTCRSGCEAAVLGNRVYLVGGFDFDVLSSVDALSLTPRHAALCAEAPASGPHVDAGDAGVADAGSPTLLLTPAATWTPMPRLKKGRTRFGMCTLHGQEPQLEREYDTRELEWL